jgi:hydrogenase maturation protease
MRLVVAYGNPLRGDDAIGWRIAERLRGTADTEIVFMHQLLPELTSRLSDATGVLFLDAAVGGQPGAVAVRHLGSDPDPDALGHVVTPAALLCLSRSVYGRSPEAVLITVSGREFGFGTELSPPLADALGGAARVAREALDRLPGSPNPARRTL